MPTSPADGSPSSRPLHRIAKLLARAGVASRREIERMIAEGRVALNGAPVETPATLLASLDGVTVDGNPVAAPEPARLFLFHKPTGVLTTERDPAGRPTIYDRLPKGLPRLMPVGRLDLNTEGVLLMTTDGGLKRQLELPATGVERAYRARAYGRISQPQLEELIEGVEIEGVRYGPIDANIERRTGTNVWIEMILKEGKNREVRRVLEHLGLQVSRLIRTRYGPFVLGDLAPGQIGEVRRHDVESFRADPARRELPQPARRRAVSVVEPSAEMIRAPVADQNAARAKPARPARPPRQGGPKNEPRRRADGSVAVRGAGGRTNRARSFRESHSDNEPVPSAPRAPRPRQGKPGSASSGRTDGVQSRPGRADSSRPSVGGVPRSPRSGGPRQGGTGASRPGGPRPPRPGKPRPPRPRGDR
ncbi:pseudouridine synthase [uncultured Sphingomonas sp.]|uniref:pseudouridine synthase n=1 Tax=unclassified Sphingomonas TaxID=196159 RepID=UPI0034185865